MYQYIRKQSVIYSQDSFTIGELLATVGIIVVLSAATVIILNPVSFIQESKDARRISDLNNLKIAVEKYKYSGLGNLSLVSVNTLYISVPDSSATCANLGLPTISGWSYKCVTSSNLKKVDGTGWIPIDFTRIESVGPFISELPIDDTNAVSTSNFYAYAVDSNGKYVLSGLLESEKKLKDTASKDGGTDDARFEVGENLTLWAQASGLAGLWRLDGGTSGSISNNQTTGFEDSSRNLNNGTAKNTNGTGMAWVSGKLGGAVNFDGTDDYVDLPNSAILSPSYVTLELWLKWDATGYARQYVFDGRGHKYMFFIDSPKELNFAIFVGGGIYGDGGVNLDSLLDGQFHQIVGTFNGTKRKLYFDSVLVQEQNVSGVLDSASNIASMGDYIGHPGGDYRINGVVDNVVVHSRALTASEIESLYKAGK